jgi:DNA repair exonuclease SbcCD ATPase subunit
MLIRIVSISGKGFMTFRDRFEFSIRNYEGKTVQIDGQNKDDEKSRSNGSGKSTLLETINWGLFGELCRKNRYKDEVVHKKEKKAQVQVDFETHRDGPYVEYFKVIRTIERKKTPSVQIWKMIRKGDSDREELWAGATYQTKQTELEKILVMNFLSFQCAIMFGRDFMNFPDLKPADRAKILTDIRGLDSYLNGSRKAGESSKSIQSLSFELDRSIGNKEGKLAGVRSTTFKDSIDTFEKDRKEIIADWEFTVTEKETELEGIKTQVEEKVRGIKLKISHLESQKNTLAESIGSKQEASDRVTNIRTDLNALIYNRDVLKGNIGGVNKEIQILTEQGEGPCPFCAQTITGKYLQSRINQLGLEVMEIKSELDTFPEKEKELRDQLKVSKELVDEIDRKIEELDLVKDSIRDFKVSLAHAESDGESALSSTVIEITSLKINIANKQKEVNPYTEMEANRKKQIKELGAEIRGMNASKNDLLDKKKYFDFWIEGFKKIRMMLFDSMISQLESLAQHYLSEYSSELNIIMTTERETRSGTIKDEFHIAIVDGNGDEVSYEMYSGGERQKIRLSISRALSQFIKDGCGVDYNVIAFDEPNDSLDDMGKDANFDTFRILSEEEGKAVLVTDHDSLFKDRFDHNVLVIKENGESTIHAQT